MLPLFSRNGVVAGYAGVNRNTRAHGRCDVDGLYVTKVGVDSVMYPGTSSGDFAFGLSMRSEAGQPTSIKFSNITFTTDATAVDAFLAGKASAQ